MHSGFTAANRSETPHLPFAMHLILFDIDGTLVDSHEFDSEMYVQAVRAVLGIEVDDDWAVYRHVTDSGILNEIMDKEGVKGDRSRIQAEVRETFAELISDHLYGQGQPLAEVPGAGAFLANLQSRPQFAIGLATGGWEETARMKLGAVGLDPDALPLASGSDAVSREVSDKLMNKLDWWQEYTADMDLNCGAIIDGEATVEEMGQTIFERILAMASGEKTRSELLGMGEHEFVPWTVGAIL